MKRKSLWVLLCAAVAMVTLPPTAAADPLPLPPLPFMPVATFYPGAFTYMYTPPLAMPPAVSDARGVRAAVSADPSAQAIGLPGSRLGNGTHLPGQLTSTNARYGIVGGVGTPVAPSVGVNIAGGQSNSMLEDPRGRPPQSYGRGEAAQPAELSPAASILEDPHGRPTPAFCSESPEATAPPC